MISLYFYGTDNITPGTDEQSLERRDNYHELREAPVAGVRQVNPHKHLEAAPIAPCQSGITAGTKRRGMNVNDQIKVAFLSVWIDYSEAPFSLNISIRKRFKAKDSIENIMKTSRLLGKLMNFDFFPCEKFCTYSCF